MPVITISHQVGSHGREIGQAVAKRLNLDYIDRQVVQAAAQQLGISEDEATEMDGKAQSTAVRILSLIAGGPDTLIVPPVNGEVTVDDRKYFQATRKVLEASATSNRVVIAGHGANFALTNKQSLSVYIYAPQEQRITTLMGRDKINHHEAEHQIVHNDQDRARYIKTFYNADWYKPTNYHLMINTGLVRQDVAVELIVQTVTKCCM